MGLDSTANLLFTIGADSSDAQGNIQRFRGILSKDLAGMKAEFADWSKNVFGDLSTAGGMFKATSAGIAAAGVAIGAALLSAADKAATYALEIDEASERTGIGAEDMSRLRYAAEVTRTSYEGLVGGLTGFATALNAARDPGSKQAEIFHRLGISQKEVEDGSRNMLPLLYRVSDAFHDNMTAVDRTAVSRQLFTRSGPALIDMLSRGSAALKGFGDEAQRVGKVIGEDSIDAAKRYRAEVNYLKASFEGLAVSIGSAVLPKLNAVFVGAEATWGGLKNMLAGGLGPQAIVNFAAGAATAGMDAVARLDAAAKASLASRTGLKAPGGDKEAPAAKAKQDYEGLSNILDQVRGRMAGLGTEEERIAYESGRLQEEVAKAAIKLSELVAAGEDARGVFSREAAALANLPAAIADLAGMQMMALADKQADAVIQAGAELQAKLAELGEQTYAVREAQFGREIAALRAEMATKKTLVGDNVALVNEIERAGLRQIGNERGAAFVKELQDLQTQLASILTARMTHAERLRFEYDQEQAQFSAVKEAEALAKYEGQDGQQEALRQQFALNRTAALQSYEAQLNALHNSTGWQGVFGAAFANAIQGDEELLRRWSESANQSLMMTEMALASMMPMAQKYFDMWAKGMGSNIAQAIVYKNSIGEAMRAATASTLGALAGEAYYYAIKATALGFLRLAEWDLGAAASAFTSAAIWGSLGTAAAVAGRAIAPQKAGGAGSGAGAGASTSSGAAAGASGGSGGGQGGPQVTIYISGPVIGPSGIDELAAMLNEAVNGRDVRLIATAVKQVSG
jgi:hypothetical protein